MKFFKQGLCLAVVGASLAAIPGLQAMAAPAADRPLVQQMKDNARGGVSVAIERSTGKVGFVRVAKGGDLMPSVDGTAAQKAEAFLAEYAGLWGITDSQLIPTRTDRTASGTTVTYTQAYRGLDVFGSMVKVNVDTDGDLTAVNGYAAPGLALSTTPRLTASEAAARALAFVKSEPPTHAEGEREVKADVSGLKVVSNELNVYRLGSTKGEAGKAILAYVLEVSNGASIRDMVVVDAMTDKVVNRWSMIHDALDRKLIEAGGSSNPATFTEVWNEGDAFPGILNQDQANEVDFTGDAYWFFKNTFGRDSYDGAGHEMVTVNNDGRINCPNANWNGSTTNYCNGVTSDDVVAHEWGHAYTEYTHGLIYQWQAGALNESYSDIWGETVDLINAKADAEEGDLTVERPVGLCSSHTPAKPTVIINSPAAIAKVCDTAAASFGPALSGTGITADVVQALDAADATGPTTFDACTAITNPAEVAGKIAIVKRGSCGFTIKVKNAQNAGAIAVLVQDNVEAAPGGLGGSDATITIPSVRIRLSDGNTIRTTLDAGTAVNVTMKDAAGDRVDSYRWLMGEDSTSFNGAIRDMWVPTCFGDPGKVSDAEYYCATDDSGGVHSNSGVPNHGYALLVDGGDYNGVSVAGIGLDKAAAIYFRAMTAYQTPTSDFTDHANALRASCTDLTGTAVNALSTVPSVTPVVAGTISATDCASVEAIIDAVELETEPTQCNFQPMFDPNTPALCGPGYKENVVWKEDFEDGLAGWTGESTIVFQGATGFPWTASTSAPGGHTGGVAFAADPREAGDCSGTASDVSGFDSLISPAIELPGATIKSPRLSFDHYVATEAGWDGGNVKVSINGGDFTVIPAAAYTFNPPAVTINTAAAGNTNPLQGQIGFSGTDGGELTGTWGQSQVDLSAVGALPGDVLQFRFDSGRDGCGGNDGWYVDNVTVSTCKAKVSVQGAHAPATSSYGTASRIDFVVQRDGTTGEAPQGTITVRKADGTLVGKDAVVDGAASISLPGTFPVGSNALTVTFSGGGTPFANETTTVSAAVRKGTSTTRAVASPNPVKVTRTITATVKVSVPGTFATGAVNIFLGTTKVGTGMLSGGVARILITKDIAVGTRTFTAKYLGSAQVSPSRGSFVVKIVR